MTNNEKELSDKSVSQSMESMLSEVLEIYRTIEGLQEKINEIYKKAQDKISNTNYTYDTDLQSDTDYLECISSYYSD